MAGRLLRVSDKWRRVIINGQADAAIGSRDVAEPANEDLITRYPPCTHIQSFVPLAWWFLCSCILCVPSNAHSILMIPRCLAAHSTFVSVPVVHLTWLCIYNLVLRAPAPLDPCRPFAARTQYLHVFVCGFDAATVLGVWASDRN